MYFFDTKYHVQYKHQQRDIKKISEQTENKQNGDWKMVGDTILKLNHISKLYPGVVALDDMNMEFREGEVHAIRRRKRCRKVNHDKNDLRSNRADKGNN